MLGYVKIFLYGVYLFILLIVFYVHLIDYFVYYNE